MPKHKKHHHREPDEKPVKTSPFSIFVRNEVRVEAPQKVKNEERNEDGCANCFRAVMNVFRRPGA